MSVGGGNSADEVWESEGGQRGFVGQGPGVHFVQ